MIATLLHAISLSFSPAVIPAQGPMTVPPTVFQAVAKAVALDRARMEVGNYRPAPGCIAETAQVPRRLLGSGTVSVQVQGKAASTGVPCRGWAWVSVRLYAPVWVASRALPAGTPLAEIGANVEQRERELMAYQHPIAELPSGARAAEPLAPGMLLEPRHVRSGPMPGESTAVVIQSGPIRVERVGRTVACGPSKACAVLENGSRMEGKWENGRIQVVLP